MSDPSSTPPPVAAPAPELPAIGDTVLYSVPADLVRHGNALAQKLPALVVRIADAKTGTVDLSVLATGGRTLWVSGVSCGAAPGQFSFRDRR